MTPGQEYKLAIKTLGLKQLEAAKLLHQAPRTLRRWGLDEADYPFAVIALLRLIIARRIPVDTAIDLINTPIKRKATQQ
jgi:hypothetical protein